MSDALIAGAVVLPLLLAYVVLVGAALLQVVRDRDVTGVARDVWIVVVVLFPVLGTIAWYGVGHRTAEARRTLARLRLGA